MWLSKVKNVTGLLNQLSIRSPASLASKSIANHLAAQQIRTKKTKNLTEEEKAARTPLIRIENGFKLFKPTSPGIRFRRMPNGGRNNSGRITVRHRGGGHKQRIRLVDFYRKKPGPWEVMRLEYDPGRSAHIALIQHLVDKEFSYILAPEELKPGMVVESFRANDRASDANLTDAQLLQEEINRSLAIKVGNCLPLRMIPTGTIIHNIGLTADGPGQMVRTAGAKATLVHTGATGFAHIKLPSGEVRMVPVDACATIGVVSNSNHQHRVLGKAGARRRLGWRPTVRGMAMNPCDHPHGGGRGKSKGNRQPVSPWGVLAKGGKTRHRPNPMVVKPRARR
ncbi:ribosomal protein L2 [Conidiobolus coronatus NRRL 28638]|uniref:Large ribosomal subunit protein uL2m n=1 Tax=Conidiobolus coronatus (strain ATCC 28846 / CBS 209.66 / NRRL 28638) TaxID=796925 RepID=A0A137PGP1_CONC2|nr:ribosomal protein L2 [Conidiobolus coronatus NRRL 28638]|eukprot:KXN74167.1 ribosomal protein L2 [Conidiobolus coronatus NRRL 28638]